MGKIKTIMSVSLVIALLLTGNAFVSFAQVNVSNRVRQSVDSMSVNYSILNDSIKEKVTFVDVDGEKAVLEQTIYANGDGQLNITKAGKTEVRQYQNQDYQMFLSIANNASQANKNARGEQIGKDIVGSQYKHILFASPEYSIDNTGVNGILSAGITGAASIIASYVPISFPLSTLATVAGFIYTVVAANNPYRIKVRQDNYEVHFSYDGIYYTHCYHQYIKSYDSGNHLIDTTRSYHQVVGG